MKILITGSSGFIGSALVDDFSRKNHEVYKLVRKHTPFSQNEILWSLDRGVEDLSLLEGMEIVIHLAGEGLMGLWTNDKKERIWKSRVEGTALLCQQLSQLKHLPKCFISASAVGYYGNQGDELLKEHHPKGEGFLADLCQKWEEASGKMIEEGVRTLHLRFGIVLSQKGGVLKFLLPIFNLGLGGCLGSGRQYMSWITLHDVLRAIDFIIEKQTLSGPINLVAPHPVRNAEFTKRLGQALNRPTFLKIPPFAVRLLPGGMGEEMLLTSQRVVPQVLEDQGFYFDFPNLESCEFSRF